VRRHFVKLLEINFFQIFIVDGWDGS
jgi:hypothetical protein